MWQRLFMILTPRRFVSHCKELRQNRHHLKPCCQNRRHWSAATRVAFTSRRCASRIATCSAVSQFSPETRESVVFTSLLHVAFTLCDNACFFFANDAALPINMLAAKSFALDFFEFNYLFRLTVFNVFWRTLHPANCIIVIFVYLSCSLRNGSMACPASDTLFCK